LNRISLNESDGGGVREVVEDGDWEEVRVAVAVAVKNRLDMDEVRCVNVVWSRYMVYP